MTPIHHLLRSLVARWTARRAARVVRCAAAVTLPAGGALPPAAKLGKRLVQTVIFAKPAFTVEAAQAWIEGHAGFAWHGADETESSIRCRQYDPAAFDADTYATIELTDDVQAVIGEVIQTAPAQAAATRCARAVQLAADAAEGDAPTPRWSQVARAGTFDGYCGPRGQESFTFDRAVFDALVRNFRSHPAYHAGPDGVGDAPVIPWDYHHASEQAATAGSLPQAGAPAQGWAYEVEVRTGADGTDQLWALSLFLEPARTYVREGRYRWASVSVIFDAVDPVTGAQVGPTLTSIALTNQPFLQDLLPLAASRRAADGGAMPLPKGKIGLCVPWMCTADSPADAVRKMRELFALGPMATEADVRASLGRLAELLIPGAQTEGVEVDDLVNALRQILGIGPLATAAETLAKAGTIIDTAAAAAAAPGAAAAAAQRSTTDMDLIILAKRLGLAAADDVAVTEDAVMEGVDAGARARAMLEALCKVLGIADAEGAVARIAELLEQAAQLQAVLPELATLRAADAARAEQAVQDEVAATMAARRLPAEMREALVLLRRTAPDRFAAQFPALPPNAAALTADVATRGGAPLAVGTSTPIPDTGTDGLDLGTYPGRNRTERALAAVRKLDPKGATLSHEEAMTKAIALSRAPSTRDSQAAR